MSRSNAEPFADRTTDFTPGAKPAERHPDLALTSPERDPAANQELAAKALEIGEMGAATRQAKRDAKKLPPGTGTEGLHIVPMPETEGFVGHDAEQHLQLATHIATQDEEKRAKLEEELYLFYQKCEHGHHGFYYTKKPVIGFPIGDDDWYSRYKPKGQVYRGWIMCQVCSMQNRRTPLHVVVNIDGSFSPDVEHIWRVPKDRQRAMFEGESRAFDCRLPGQNAWREEHNSRLKEHGYETV